MDCFSVQEILAQAAAKEQAALEFFRAASLSLLVYRLPADGTDAQRPHTEDEIYYVVRGRGRFRAGTEDVAVAPGSVLFVAAGVEHRFHAIEEDLELLVVFAPPEGSQRDGAE